MSRPRKQQRQANGKNAVLYIRVSTKEQGKKGRYGVDAQLCAVLEYCTKHGYTIVGACSDIGKSGTLDSLEREGLTQAMTLAKTGTADVIVAAAQDRLARGSVFDEIRSMARKDGYRLEAVKESMDVAADENELTGDAMAFVATIERKNIAKRTLAGRKERAKIDGRSSSYVPFGYKLDSDNLIAIDEKQAAIVRFILSEREAGRPYQEIADRLRYNGDEKPSGGTDWNVGNVQTIEKRADLYKTGMRVWGDIEASVQWPIIMK